MRLPNWPQLLAATVEAWRFRPFEYGVSDCLQFPAETTLAITGVDYRPRFPRYASELGAARILVRCAGVSGLVTTVLGAPIPIRRAGRGDLVAGEFGHGMAIGVCVGIYCCSPGAEGLVFRKTALAALAWSVN